MNTEAGLRRWLRRPMAWAGLAFAVAAVLTGVALRQPARLAVPTPMPAPHPTPSPSPTATANPEAAHELSPEALRGMVERLQQRLAAQPADAEGWAMLARTLAVAGQHEQSLPAFRKAEALRPDDPVLLADYADALAMSRGRRLDGEPLALVKRALALAPDNLKALSLAGTEAFDRGDWGTAIRHWERLRDQAGPEHPMWRQVEGGLREARERRDGGASTAAVRRP